MRRPLRLALGALGLAVTLLGGASLNGGRIGSSWLWEPPWWEGAPTYLGPDGVERPQVMGHNYGEEIHHPHPGREWISGGVTAAGLGLLAWAACPRKQGKAKKP